MILYAAWAVLLVVSIPAAVSGDSWVLLLSAPAAYFFFNVYKTQERIQADYPKAAAQYQKQRQNLLQKIEQLQNQLEA